MRIVLIHIEGRGITKEVVTAKTDEQIRNHYAVLYQSPVTKIETLADKAVRRYLAG